MFFQQFGLLFVNMQWYVILMLALAFVLFIIEALQPGFGVFGISGLVLLVASHVLRLVLHRDNDIVLVQFFQLIILDIAFIGLVILIIFIAWKAGWIKKTPFFLAGTAVNKDRSDGTIDYSFLVGKEGTTTTQLRPSGKVEIDGKFYDVESTGFYIDVNSSIIVTEIKDGVIKVTTKETITTGDKEHD